MTQKKDYYYILRCCCCIHNNSGLRILTRDGQTLLTSVAPGPNFPSVCNNNYDTNKYRKTLSTCIVPPRLRSSLYHQGAIGEAKFIRTLRQIENEAIQAPSAKAGATPLSDEVKFY